MRYLVYDDMSRMTAADVDRLLALVSVERREKALRYSHLFGQWTTLKSALMLYELLEGAELALPSHWRELPWEYNEYGKPFLPGGPEFSISHCKRGIAVAIDSSPIGIDIEAFHPYNESLARRVMNEKEMREIDEAALDEVAAPLDEAALDEVPEALDGRAVAFTRLWTQKEAVLKLRGTGIIDDLRDVLTHAPEQIDTYTNLQGGYCYSIAKKS